MNDFFYCKENLYGHINYIENNNKNFDRNFKFPFISHQSKKT